MAKISREKQIQDAAKRFGIDDLEVLALARKAENPVAYLGMAADTNGESKAVTREQAAPEKRVVSVEKIKQITITVPLASELQDEYVARGVEVRHLTKSQRDVLHRLLKALRAANETLLSGKPVYQKSDVIRWLLECIAS